jgi:molybdopterin-guanine dinucleotide biosynthesis protein A
MGLDQDKGLIMFRGQPMVTYALTAMKGVADCVVINANRNLEWYQRFGVPLISDETLTFDGPLAGILSVMNACDTEVLIVMPCDSPLIQSRHLEKLRQALIGSNYDVAVAHDGERMHPVFLALNTHLLESLQFFLSEGQRKIDVWLRQHTVVEVDFSEDAKVFLNINTVQELANLEDI